jgi:hypothetical protein
MAGISKYYKEEGEVQQAAASFWQWFVDNEHRFREHEKNDSDQALSFLEELIQEMQPFNSYLKALAGPDSNGNYELIITSDGDIALFCKVEELVNAAPPVPNWLFTAHKPALGFESISIDLYGLQFTTATTSFYPIVQEKYPDEVNIVLTHTGYDKELDDHFQAGGMIYLENGLGEVNTATKIDNYETGPLPAEDKGIEVIPISKLNEYLNWREKEFVEKYESVPEERPDTFHLLEAEDKDGKKMLLAVNMECRYWDKKPAYSWLLQVNINYTGDETGFPFEEQLMAMQTLEEEMFTLLPEDRTILAGNKTYDNCKNIYFYVSEYKTTAALLNQFVENKETPYEILFFIRRDKYWRTMEQYFNLPIED